MTIFSSGVDWTREENEGMGRGAEECEGSDEGTMKTWVRG